MVREDLVLSAVTFLQDPSVATAALDKRIEFLRSKNLTQEEVDAALARASDGTQSPERIAQQSQQPGYGYQNQQSPREPPAYGYGYDPYQRGSWAQPPPAPPRRDWRDWFIMATVTTGVGYGLYTAAQRYILPIISPPTPPQIEQDKAAIDESFNKAFALIDQLTKDTADIKSAENERTEKLDTTMRDVNNVVADLKAANTRRDAESRIIADQVQGLKELVPKSLEGWKANGDARLDELGQEIQSLKRLLENRVGKSAATSTPTGRGQVHPTSEALKNTQSNTSSGNGISTADTETANKSAPAPGITVPRQENPTQKGGSRSGDRRAAIPAWQMAAAKSNSTTSSTNGEANASEAGA